MKKWMFLSGLVLFFTLAMGITVHAQNDDVVIEEVDEAMGTDEYRQKGFQTSRLFTGGTLGLGFGNVQANVEVSPQLGYRVTDHLHVGVNFTYIFQSFRNDFGPNVTQSFIGGGPFLRYMVVNFDGMSNNYGKETGLPMSGLYVHAEFQRIRGKNNVNDLTVKENAMFLGAGYAANFYRGFSYNFEILYNPLWEDNTSIYAWPVLPRAGIYYGF